MKSLRAKEKAVQVRSERVTCSVHVFSAVLTYLPQLYDQIRPPLPREPAVLTSCHSRISEGNFTTVVFFRGRRTDTMLATRMGCGDSKAKPAEPQASNTVERFKDLCL